MIREEILGFLEQEDGVGVIEVVLILVVLIGLVIIFKGQITALLNDIFKQINSQSKEVY
ncbi:MAG: hypothetical protein HFG64_16150 [Lachnospiraceae bacterium]|nr:hypothetical protein [Lachnospiraceae bacterium]